MTKQLVSMIVLWFSSVVMAGSMDVDGGSDFKRYNASAWVQGDILTRSIQVYVHTRGATDPKSGNIGTFDVDVYMRGSYLENSSYDDIEFQKAHPYQSNGGRIINRVTPAEGPWGTYYEFNPTLQINWQTTGSVWTDTGPGKGMAEGPVVPQTFGYANTWFGVVGGSIISSSYYLTTNEFPVGNPGFDDWNANAHFSGIIEAADFQVVGTPEPASLGLLAIGSSVLLKRRRRLA